LELLSVELIPLLARCKIPLGVGVLQKVVANTAATEMPEAFTVMALATFSTPVLSPQVYKRLSNAIKI
jgi:hypothetical protein